MVPSQDSNLRPVHRKSNALPTVPPRHSTMIVGNQNEKTYFDIIHSSLLANYTVSQKKVPTFELSVTLSNLDRFLKCLHCWKAYEICYKSGMTLPISP